MSHLFCFGLGYTAAVIAKRLQARSWTVTGTSSSREGAQALRRQGFRGHVFAGEEHTAEIVAVLREATHVLLSIPPDDAGDPAARIYEHDIETSPTVAWIGYFSTVGVYGDSDGDWVNEDTRPAPSSVRGRRRLDAEYVWQALGGRTGKLVSVFRLPGIYGPGRSAIDDLLEGRARRIVKPGQVFNRVHVDDIASAVLAAIARPGAGGIYNVTDDEPSPPQDVVAYAAELLGVPCPPEIDFQSAELSPMARSFFAESKRVSNGRLKAELGVELDYPTYREGLKSIAAKL